MNKKFMIPMFAVFGISLVFAVPYIMNSFAVQVDVAEPFDVSYAI